MRPGTTFGAEELDSIAAVVNDDVIMMSELDFAFNRAVSTLREQGTPLPPDIIIQKQVLDSLIRDKLQIQMALETGIRVDDETLNRTITQIAAEQQVTLSQFREILDSEPSYSYGRFREDIRNEILKSRLQQRQVNNRVMVTDREIDNYLANLEHMGESDREYNISHILISIPEGTSAQELADIRSKANKVLEELKAGKDFAEMAVKNSDSSTAAQGGDLGWLKSGQIPTLFTDFIADMQEGDISSLITSPSGYHIIKLSGVRASEKIIVTQTHSRQIVLRPNEFMSEKDVIQRLEQLKLRVEGGEDFAELAKGNSIDTLSASDGGDMGWMSPGESGMPEYEEVMNSLSDNQVSRPFATQYGFHIIQVLGRREHDSSEDIRRARAREAIRERKLQETRDSWLRQLRDDAYVEYRIDF